MCDCTGKKSQYVQKQTLTPCLVSPQSGVINVSAKADLEKINVNSMVGRIVNGEVFS